VKKIRKIYENDIESKLKQKIGKQPKLEPLKGDILQKLEQEGK